MGALYKEHLIKSESGAMRDKGTREVFGANTAQRESNQGKSRMELISPYAWIRLGHWVGLGAEKYGTGNWEKGMPFSRCIGSILRHTMGYMLGDKTEDHLAAIMCNAMFLIHYEEKKMTRFNDLTWGGGNRQHGKKKEV